MKTLFWLVGSLTAAAVFLACSSSPAGSDAPDGPDSASRGDGGASGGDGSAEPGPSTPIGQDVTGVATYYDATGAGNCSFDATPNDLDVGAMNPVHYADSAACGECVAIDGPKGKVTVRIVDSCPDCESGQVDLSKSAFAKIADVSAGRVPIIWRVVSCSVTGNVSYHYKKGSSEYWTAIQVRNHRVPIAKLEIATPSGFVNVVRQSYNYFVYDKGAGPSLVKVRITSVDGQTIEDTLAPAASDVDAPGASQFK